MLSGKGEGDDNNLRFGGNLGVFLGQVAGGSTLKTGHCPSSWSAEPWVLCLPTEGQMTQGVGWGTCCHHVVLYQEERILCWAMREEGAAGKIFIGLGTCVNRQDKLIQLALDPTP